MEDRIKTCSNCKNAYVPPERPRSARCRRSTADEKSDASLCGEMRKGACGPAAKLWEDWNGQA